MIIYVDLLVAVNFILDFLLFSVAAIIVRTDIKTLRQILAAALGGLSSLYIFLESKSFFFDILFRLISSAVIVLVCVGIKSVRRYLKFYFAYLAVSFLLGGVMYFLSEATSSRFMTVNNTYVYLNISPVLLIVTTFVIYISIKLYFKFKRTPQIAKSCTVTVMLENKKMKFSALIDTGNKVKDLLGSSEVIFISPKGFIEFIGVELDMAKDVYGNRFRLIPISTVSGSSVKGGIRIDKAIILCERELFELLNPILLVSDNNFNDEFQMIISSETLLKQPIKVFKEGEEFEAFK